MPKAGFGAAGEDIALDADHGTDEGRPSVWVKAVAALKTVTLRSS